MSCPDDIDVNAIDIEGRTAMFLASWNSNGDIVKVLMENTKADINKSDRMGWTPLQGASHRHGVFETWHG